MNEAYAVVVFLWGCLVVSQLVLMRASLEELARIVSTYPCNEEEGEEEGDEEEEDADEYEDDEEDEEDEDDGGDEVGENVGTLASTGWQPLPVLDKDGRESAYKKCQVQCAEIGTEWRDVVSFNPTTNEYLVMLEWDATPGTETPQSDTKPRPYAVKCPGCILRIV